MERDHHEQPTGGSTNSSHDKPGDQALPEHAQGLERADEQTDANPEEQAHSPEHADDDGPRIWVGSLSDYNNGVLHGDWIDAAREPDEIWADVHRILAESPTTARTGEPAEEWGIFDYDGFGSARVYQHDHLDGVARVARGIAEHGLAFAAWADVMEGDEQALNQFEDAYLGHYDSVEAYAEQLIDDLGYEQLLDEAIPDHLRSYVRIDTDALARDMQLGGDIHAITAEDGGVWLFDARQ